MLRPNANERKILTVFFRVAAPQYGLFHTGKRCVLPETEQDPVYQKNLEIYRESLVKKIDDERLIDYCRLCAKEKRQVQWITEVVPNSETDLSNVDRNLLRDGDSYFHRKLIKIEMPVAHLAFGADAEEVTGQPVVKRVETYTLSELIKYFSSSLDIHMNSDREKSFAGAFNYLLRSYPLDVILFAIDSAVEASARVRMPLELQGVHIPLAEDYIRDRIGRAAITCSGT